MTGHYFGPFGTTSKITVWIAAVILLCAVAACDRHSPQISMPAPMTPEILIEVSVREDGTASPTWTSGIAVAIGEVAASDAARDRLPFSPQAAAWLDVLEDALSLVKIRAGELATLFDVPPIDAKIVVGNRASADAFGWVPDNIGINVQAFTDTYGPPAEGATERMVRIVAHEYLHLLTYAFYRNHQELRQTPIDRALWTIFFEGIGDYVSLSSRWMPDEQGRYSTVASDTLKRLEPVLIERLEMLATADSELEPELRAGISDGKFDEKWGSLPFALWLHSEVRRCGEAATLQAIFRLERNGVLLLASRYAAAELQPRIVALQEKSGPEFVRFESYDRCRQ